jgi:hypothetical protein
VHCYYANGALVSNCDALQYLCIGHGEHRRMIGLDAAGPTQPVHYAKKRGSRRRVA